MFKCTCILLRVVSSGYPKSSVWICPFAAEIERCCWDCPKVPSSLCGGKSVVSLYLQSQFRARFLAGCFEAVPPRAVARSGSSTTRSSAKSDRIVPWGCSLVPGNSELSSTCSVVFRCTYYFSWPVIATRHLEGCWVLMPVSPMRPLVLNQTDSWEASKRLCLTIASCAHRVADSDLRRCPWILTCPKWWSSHLWQTWAAKKRWQTWNVQKCMNEWTWVALSGYRQQEDLHVFGIYYIIFQYIILRVIMYGGWISVLSIGDFVIGAIGLFPDASRHFYSFLSTMQLAGNSCSRG